MNGERRLFRYVLGIALHDDDALEWLACDDGRLICELAGVEPEYLRRKLVERSSCDRQQRG
jgi:hypothetical protein